MPCASNQERRTVKALKGKVKALSMGVGAAGVQMKKGGGGSLGRMLGWRAGRNPTHPTHTHSTQAWQSRGPGGKLGLQE